MNSIENKALIPPRLRDDVQFFSGETSGHLGKTLVVAGQRYFLVDAMTSQLLQSMRIEWCDYRELSQHLVKEYDLICDIESLQLQISAFPSSLFSKQEPRNPFILSWRFLSGPAVQILARPLAMLFSWPLFFITLAVFFSSTLILFWRLPQLTHLNWAEAAWGQAFALSLIGTLIHELGHCAAIARFGARQNGIGVGLYWIFPTFYAEVHDAWRLPRWQRVAVDGGGIYLQAIFVSVLIFLFLLEPNPTIVLAIWLSFTMMLNTLNPVMKFDGYWLLSDALQVHNLHSQMKRMATQWLDVFLGRRSYRGMSVSLSIGLVIFLLLAFVFLSNMFVFYGKTLGIQIAISEMLFSNHASNFWPLIGHLFVVLVLLVLGLINACKLAGSLSSFRSL